MPEINQGFSRPEPCIHTVPIDPNDALYPEKVKTWYTDQPLPTLYANGNLELLQKDNPPRIALFASRTCPGSLLLPARDTAALLRDNGQTVISGFHSPLEQECLHIFFRGSQPVIICPARSIHTMRVPATWKQPMAEERLLVLSPFAKEKKRITQALARQRNQLVAALADTMFIVHAPPDSEISALAANAIKQGKNVFVPDAPENTHLFRSGAQTFSATGNTSSFNPSR